jgi:hypothetical protein
LELSANNNHIEEKLSRQMPHEQVTLITITQKKSDRLTWIEKNKEFRYENNMYDVIKIKRRNDTTFYYCFNDTRERNLISYLKELVQEQSDHSKSKPPHKKPSIDYLIPQNIMICNVNADPIHYYDYPVKIEFVSKEVFSPPS